MGGNFGNKDDQTRKGMLLFASAAASSLAGGGRASLAASEAHYIAILYRNIIS